MKPRYQVSRAAIELIKRFEGYRSKAAQLPDGRWTIGYGHTLAAREGATVSMDDAEALLVYDLIDVAHTINEHTYTPLTQNQFDALCAFAFNIGVESFRRSTVLRRLNEGALLQAACAMELWRKADFEGERIVIDALVRRRAAEKSLFLTPPGGFVPVPTPVLRPNLDMDGAGSVPRQAPTALTASLDGAVTGLSRDETAPAPDADEPPSPAQAAAAAVSARLASIFADDEPDGDVLAESEPQPGVEPEPSVEPTPVFELVAPEPDTEPELAVEPEIETSLDEAAEPTLIDAPILAANDIEPTADLETESTPEPEVETHIEEPHLELSPEVDSRPADEFVAEFEPLADSRTAGEDDFPHILGLEPETADFEDATPRPRFKYLPLVALAALGGAIFGGGIFWSVSAQGGAWAFGWLASLVGIVVMGRAAYLFLERLGQIGGGLDDDLNSK